eukprot:3600728-Alexandrium_andersonii.AAC.2
MRCSKLELRRPRNVLKTCPRSSRVMRSAPVFAQMPNLPTKPAGGCAGSASRGVRGGGAPQGRLMTSPLLLTLLEGRRSTLELHGARNGLRLDPRSSRGARSTLPSVLIANLASKKGSLREYGGTNAPAVGGSGHSGQQPHRPAWACKPFPLAARPPSLSGRAAHAPGAPGALARQRHAHRRGRGAPDRGRGPLPALL